MTIPSPREVLVIFMMELSMVRRSASNVCRCLLKMNWKRPLKYVSSCRHAHHMSSPRVPVDIPPRGHYLKALETPKHITPVGRHHLSTSTYFGTDSWWEFVTLHPRKPCRRLAGTCACLSRSYYPTLTPFTSYLASQGALTTLTCVM